MDEPTDRAIVDALRGQELSGFEIWRWLGSAQGIPNRLTEAHLYPTLYRLEAEGLLQSDWRAGERTRRKYRPTARALERADEPDWSPAGSRANQGQFRAPDRAGRRLASPDPEAGSWFMPKDAVAAPVPAVPAALAAALPAVPAALPAVHAAAPTVHAAAVAAAADGSGGATGRSRPQIRRQWPPRPGRSGSLRGRPRRPPGPAPD